MGLSGRLGHRFGQDAVARVRNTLGLVEFGPVGSAVLRCAALRCVALGWAGPIVRCGGDKGRGRSVVERRNGEGKETARLAVEVEKRGRDSDQQRQGEKEKRY